MPSAGEEREQLQLSYIVDGYAEWYNLCGSLAVPYKVKSTLPYNPANLILKLYPNEIKIYVHIKICVQIF